MRLTSPYFYLIPCEIEAVAVQKIFQHVIVKYFVDHVNFCRISVEVYYLICKSLLYYIVDEYATRYLYC